MLISIPQLATHLSTVMAAGDVGLKWERKTREAGRACWRPGGELGAAQLPGPGGRLHCDRIQQILVGTRCVKGTKCGTGKRCVH